MLCQKMQRKQIAMWLLAIGGVSLLFGLAVKLLVEPKGSEMEMLSGMFTGSGLSTLVVSAVIMVRTRMVPKEKLEQEEIDITDERNIAIGRAAAQVGMYTATAVLAVLAFVLVAMGYSVPSYLCVAALYVVAIATLVARRYYNKHM